MCKNGCGGNGGAVNPQLIIPVPASGEKYVFSVSKPLRMTERKIGDTTYIHFEIVPYSGPRVALTVAPASIELGQATSVLFSANIELGSEQITARSITPEDDIYGMPWPLTNSFTFSVPDITGNAPGPAGLHTLTATDTEGNSVSASAAIQVQNRHFILYSVHKNLTAAELQAAINAGQGTVAANIQQAYGAMRPYQVPPSVNGQKHYIHWIYPVAEAGIGTPTDDTGSPLPVDVAAGELLVTNAYGVQVRYRNAHSSYSYGAYTFNFQF